MGTILAQATAQAVVAGPGSIGPFPVPPGSAGVRMVIDRTGLPAVDPLLTIICLESFDGGQTFAPVVEGTMSGEPIALPDGSTQAQSYVGFLFGQIPTHVRIDVNAAQPFTANFQVLAL